MLSPGEEPTSPRKDTKHLDYATDCQGARAPPPSADPDAPELPFPSHCDGIAYELQPWEQARQQRLQQYAQLRDQVAGIVVYNGDRNDAKENPPKPTPGRKPST